MSGGQLGIWSTDCGTCAATGFGRIARSRIAGSAGPAGDRSGSQKPGHFSRFHAHDLRSEVTAALLACRVLDAYEDLVDRESASGAVLAAVAYLYGVTDKPPPPPPALAVRDSEAVDLALAERIDDVRALLDGAASGRQATGRPDARRCRSRDGANLNSPLPRAVYGRGVLGRVVLYVCN